VLPGKTYTGQDVVRIVRKRGWLIALPFFVGTIAGGVLYKTVPSQYRSETLIMVIPQRVPETYVTPTITGSIEDRLPSINDQILSRSRLERIINDLDLYKEQRATGVMEDVVSRMRSEIDVKLVGKESFRVSYVSREPRTAQRVADRLAGLYIEESLRDRENISEDTNQFLESQLQAAKSRLLEHEQKLLEYRRQYSGQLPSQLPANVQAIQNAQMQMQSVSESLNRARERRLVIERQLADAQATPSSSVSAVPNGPDSTVGASAGEQLEAARSRLDALKLRYKPDHPDVRALERVISELETKAAAEAQNRPGRIAAKVQSPSDIAREKRIKDLQAEVEMIDRQIGAGVLEEARLKNEIADYQTKVDAVPTRESELVELTRDYGTLQEQYSSLLKKQEDSRLAANLEHRQIGEHFKILDPASLPQKAFNQKVKLMAFAAGTGGGLVLGLVFVGLLEYRDSSFRTEIDITRALSLPVLALVPEMHSDAEEAEVLLRRRRRVLFSIGLTMVIVLGSAAALAFRWIK
jgi:polysaccharide chain length determinant protein (PEP-CTERM system associated)